MDVWYTGRGVDRRLTRRPWRRERENGHGEKYIKEDVRVGWHGSKLDEDSFELKFCHSRKVDRFQLRS